jgi:hypothetical protein
MHEQALPGTDTLSYFDSEGYQDPNGLIYGQSTSACAKLI